MYNTYILYITMLKRHGIIKTSPERMTPGDSVEPRRVETAEGKTLYSSLL